MLSSSPRHRKPILSPCLLKPITDSSRLRRHRAELKRLLERLEKLPPCPEGTLGHENFRKLLHRAMVNAQRDPGFDEADVVHLVRTEWKRQNRKVEISRRPRLLIVTPDLQRKWARDKEKFDEEMEEIHEELALGKEAALAARKARAELEAKQAFLVRLKAQHKVERDRTPYQRKDARRGQRAGSKASLIALSEGRARGRTKETRGALLDVGRPRRGSTEALIALSATRSPAAVLQAGMRGVLGTRGMLLEFAPLPKRLEPIELLDASSLVNEDFGDGMDEEGFDTFGWLE